MTKTRKIMLYWDDKPHVLKSPYSYYFKAYYEKMLTQAVNEKGRIVWFSQEQTCPDCQGDGKSHN